MIQSFSNLKDLVVLFLECFVLTLMMWTTLCDLTRTFLCISDIHSTEMIRHSAKNPDPLILGPQELRTTKEGLERG